MINHCGLVNDEAEHIQHEYLIKASWHWLAHSDYLILDRTGDKFNLTLRSFEGLTVLEDDDSQICRGDRLRQLAKQVADASVAGVANQRSSAYPEPLDEQEIC